MILVYAEQSSGKFRKSGIEALSYGYALSQKLSDKVTAISIGNVADDELQTLAKYGASKILNTNDGKLNDFSASAYAHAIVQAAQQENASVIILSNTFSGKGLAPRIAARLDAGYVNNAMTVPESSGFTIRTGAYSGKAFADVEILSDKKVISVAPNAFGVKENPQQAIISSFSPSLSESDLKIKVKESVKAGDKISLPEAERVVSAGRGLKGPENWGMIEELAKLLDAATACSKPVSDSNWRPHSEHVGQTGIAISPSLYLAIGISGAIQHLAGVSNSKVIVVINKDPEAPFFKAADYGIAGDAFEVVPKLINAVKKFKGITV